MAFAFLEGYRVLDMGQYVPGPYGSLLLADLGAEVVKIEPPGGEPMRRLGPIDEDGVSPFYKVMNGGKTVITIDLKTDQGLAEFRALAGAADALIESYRPGVMERLGIGYPALSKLNPGLVHCALSGYGQTGPYRLRAGHDLNYMALGGGLATSGSRETPVITAPPVSDYASGVQAAATVMAALLGRARTGRGAYLDLSLVETVLAWQSVNLVSALRPGYEPRKGSSLLNGGLACYQIYRTSDDRFMTLGAIEDKFWANFCEALEHPEWIERQWEPMPQVGLISEVLAMIGEQPLSHWNAVLDDVDCCYQAVVDLTNVADHPQVAAREMMVRTDGAVALLESLYPAWVDGVPPAPRPPFREAAAADVVGDWTAAAKTG